MREDPVISGFAKARKFITENTTIVVAALVVVVVAAAGFSAYNSMKRKAVAKAQESFGNAMVAYTGGNKQKAVEALSQVSENYGNTPHGAYAAYLLGTILVEEKRHDEAQRWFEMASSRARDGNVVKGLALEELGTVFERAGNLEKATESLRKALELEVVEYRWPAIRWKLALINQKQGNEKEAQEICQALVNDTLAVAYKDKAENLLTEIRVQQSM